MQEILEGINRIAGVRGCMVMGTDGLPIATDLSVKVDDNTVAALASNLILQVADALRRLHEDEAEHCVLTAAQGHAVLFLAGRAVLLTLTGPEANIGMLMVELRESSRRLTELLNGAV